APGGRGRLRAARAEGPGVRARAPGGIRAAPRAGAPGGAADPQPAAAARSRTAPQPDTTARATTPPTDQDARTRPGRERPPPARAGLPRFEVEDTLDALGRLARARRRLLPAASPVVAITGSSGKTSTKEMVRAALATRYRVHATSGNLNNLVGVPLTILAAAEDRNALVVEVGASVPGEIARLRAIVEPTIAVVTNVTPPHLEGLGSLDGALRQQLARLE